MIKHQPSLQPNAHSLIDKFMPEFDVSEYHETTVRAPIETVFAALGTTDLAGSPIIRLLIRLRALPTTSKIGGSSGREKLDLATIMKAGFVLLGENHPNEIALGLIGRFWTLSGAQCRVRPEEFVAFDQPGYAKAVWNFSLAEKTAGITRLATETRVRCLDHTSRQRFRVYWTLIAPFSGLIRREALRLIRLRSEASV